MKTKEIMENRVKRGEGNDGRGKAGQEDEDMNDNKQKGNGANE